MGYDAPFAGQVFGERRGILGLEGRGDPLMTSWDSAERAGRSPHSHPWLAEFLFAFDARLRRHLAVFEYSADSSCIFRLEIGDAPRRIVLRDGTGVQPGGRIARLHFWNEHIPPVPKSGATIAWARRMQQAIAHALRELARYLASRPDLADVGVICADVPSGTRTQSEQLARIMAYYGFEAITPPEPLPLNERLRRFGENILISLVVFAQNAATLRLDTLQRARLPIFLSRWELERRFGEADVPAGTRTVQLP